jgi:hypothetical protein
MNKTDTELESQVERILESKLDKIEDEIACKVADRLAPRLNNKRLSDREHECEEAGEKKKMFDPLAGP